MNDESFEVDHSNVDITAELSRVSAPPLRDPGRQIIVKVPTLPAGLAFVELETASAELDRCRAIAGAAVAALASAEARLGAAHNADLAQGADALRRGEAPAPSAVAALEADIRGLVGNRDAARVLVASVETELDAVLSEHRADYQRRLDAAIGADRDDALAALDAYAAARGTVLADLSLRAWLAGGRKIGVGQLPELRGITSSDRPAPRHEDVLASLRRELSW